MKKELFFLVFIFCYSYGFCQYEYEVSFNIAYSTYKMSEMKSFQAELHEGATSSINVPFAITDNFPSFPGYELTFSMLRDRLNFGTSLGYRSTAGRISYADFSGSYIIDNKLRGIDATFFAGYTLLHLKSIKLISTFGAGITYTKHEILSNLALTGIEHQTVQNDFESFNILIAPGLKGRFIIVGPVFFDLFLRYDLNIPQKLNSKDIDGAYLIDEDGGEVRADWSGARIGMGLGVKF